MSALSPRRRARRPLGVLAAALLAALLAGVAVPPVGALSRAEFPVLALGSYGADVLALQRLLRHHAHGVSVSGVFDGPTEQALAAFQSSSGLPADGVARPPTWRALVPQLAAGASGEAVRAVQELLNRKRGAGLAVSGSFDAATELEVRRLQMRLGLPRSGTVDADTWRHLVWLFVRPRLGGPLCGYEVVAGRSAKWGTAGAVAQLERAAALYAERTGSGLAVGDISLEAGGETSGHATHEVGLDVDIRPARSDGLECRWGIAHHMRGYDRAGTRALIQAIHDAAPGRVKLIYFNDPVLVREGLVRRYPNHDAHLHVRYCEVDHQAPAYRCSGAARSVDAGWLEQAASATVPTDGDAVAPDGASADGAPTDTDAPAHRTFLVR